MFLLHGSYSWTVTLQYTWCCSMSSSSCILQWLHHDSAMCFIMCGTPPSVACGTFICLFIASLLCFPWGMLLVWIMWGTPSWPNLLDWEGELKWCHVKAAYITPANLVKSILMSRVNREFFYNWLGRFISNSFVCENTQWRLVSFC